MDTKLEDRVAKEIREWSAYALEKPNENYNDFPACPFASISADFFGDRDLYVMGFHPEDESNEIINDGGFETDIDEVYTMIFVQRLSLLCKASEKLMSKGYYNRDAGNYEIQDIMKRRNELYRRIHPNGT